MRITEQLMDRNCGTDRLKDYSLFSGLEQVNDFRYWSLSERTNRTSDHRADPYVGFKLQATAIDRSHSVSG